MSLSPRRRPRSLYSTVVSSNSNLSFTPAKELVPGDPDYNIGNDWPAYFTKHLDLDLNLKNHPPPHKDNQEQQPVVDTDKKRTKKQRRKEKKKRHSAPARIIAPNRRQDNQHHPLLWVQLVMGDQPIGQPAELDGSSLDHVHALKKAIKEEYAVELEQVSAARLQVFFDTTTTPHNNNTTTTSSKPLAANAPLPERATYDHPIVVVAPATTATTTNISLASTFVAATTQPKVPLPPPTTQATTTAASKKNKDTKKTTTESKAKPPNNNKNNNNKRRDDIKAKAAKLAASFATTQNNANNDKRDQIKAKAALLAKDANGSKAPAAAATATTTEKNANNNNSNKRDQIKAKGAGLAKQTNGKKTHAAVTKNNNNISNGHTDEQKAKAAALLAALAAESNPGSTGTATKTNVNTAKKREEQKRKTKTKTDSSATASQQNKNTKKTSSTSSSSSSSSSSKRDEIIAKAAALAAQYSSSNNNVNMNNKTEQAKAVPVADPAAASTKPKKKKKPQQEEQKDIAAKPITGTTTATTKTTDTTTKATAAAAAAVKKDKRVRVQGKVDIALASEFVTLGYKDIGAHEAMGLRNADTKRTCIFCRRKVKYECTHEICQQRKVEHMGKSFWGIPICPHARGPRKDLEEFGMEANTKTCLELHAEQLQLAFDKVKAEKESPAAPRATTYEEPVVNHKKRGRPIGSANKSEENGDKNNKTKKRKANASTDLAAMMVATGAGNIGVHQVVNCRNLLNEKHSERHCLVCGRRIRTECSHDICQTRNVVNNQGKETRGAPICDPQNGPRTHIKQYGLEANAKTCLQLHIEELEKEFDIIKATQLAEPFAM